MKLLTNDVLRELYLHDLKTSKTEYNGTWHPKVKNPGAYEQFKPVTNTVGFHPMDTITSAIKVWIWSDQHFGHENIIRFAKRPFPNACLMNACLVGNYTNVVRNGDIVIFGGDVAFGNTGEANMILDELPGYKILVLGNHDLRHGMYTKLHFDEIVLTKVLKYPLVEDRWINVAFTHIPITNKQDWVDENTLFFHGHLHDKKTDDPLDVNFSVEQTNYAPVLLSDIVEARMTQTMQFLNSPFYEVAVCNQ